LKRLAQGIVLLLVLLLALLAAAPFTAPGTRLLLALLPSSAPLQVEYGSGRLAGELRLRRLVLATEGFELELTDLHTELEAGCLWQSRFCFTKLDLGSVAFEVFPAEEIETAPTASEPLELPVSVVAPRVQIAELQVRWPGGSWQQQQSSLAVEVGETGIVLDEVAVAGGLLTLEADTEPAPIADPEPLELPEIALPLLLVVESLELQAPRLRLGEVEHGLERLAVALRWQGTELTLGRFEADSAEFGALNASGELNLAGAWPLALQLDVRPASAVLPEALQGRSFQLGLDGPADALAIALTAPGEPALELSAEANLLNPALPFTAEARMSGQDNFALAQLPGWPPGLADASLTLPVMVAAEGNLESQAMTLQAELVETGYPLLDVRLAASHSEGNLVVQELQLTDVAGEGSVEVAGTLAYGEELRWQATLESPGMELPALSEYLFGKLQGRLTTTGTLAGERWQTSLDEVAISGEINGLPATLSGDLALAAGSYITAGELVGEANGARLRLHGGSGSETAAVVEVSIADLGRWQRSSRGSAQLRGEWRAEDASVILQGSLNGVRWDENRIDEGTLSGELDLAANGVLAAGLSLQQVTVGDVFLGTVAAQVSGTREEPRLVLSSGGRLAGELQLAGRQDGDSWTVQVDTDGVQTPLGPLTLETPFSVRYGPDSSSMEAHCWRLPESTLCASEWILGASGGGTEALDGDLALFGALLPQQLQVSGLLTASLRAEWQPDTPLRATAQIQSPEGTITQFYPEGESATLSWDSLTANLEQGADGLVLNAAMQREGARVVTLAVRLPGDSAEALDGSLDLEQLELAALRPFLPQLSRLEGELRGALRLAGTQAEPEVLGELAWSGGALAAHANPTELRAVELMVTLLGDRAELEGTARLGGGELEISGDASLRPEFELSLALRGEDNRLLYPPSTEMVVSPDLSLRATTEGVMVGGEVLVKSGILAYEQLPAGSVSLSPDVVEVDYAGKVVTPESPFDLNAEVRVRIRDKFRVQGADLNVTVGGDLSLQQVSGQPLQVFGNLNIVGGEFRAYGQRLRVRQGRISFTGQPENPELNLRAEREIPADDVKAGVRVSGTLEQPQITLYSEPAMSQTETLSYLVRGRGMDSGAGADGTAMALSVGTGLVNQSGIVEGLNSLPGLRNVEFGAEGSEDETAATVSGYIGERIYLSYGVGLYEPVNALTARLYLQARLWLEVVSRLESSVDLYYSFDID